MSFLSSSQKAYMSVIVTTKVELMKTLNAIKNVTTCWGIKCVKLGVSITAIINNQNVIMA